jgi:RNA-binding protein 25
MQGLPNRMGLGMRPPAYGAGQGPSMSALAQQQQMAQPAFTPQHAQPQHNLFVGSISGGITDAFLNELLGVCPSHEVELTVILNPLSGLWSPQDI